MGGGRAHCCWIAVLLLLLPILTLPPLNLCHTHAHPCWPPLAVCVTLIPACTCCCCRCCCRVVKQQWWVVQGGCGVFLLNWWWPWTLHSQMQVGGGGWGLKTQNQATMAWFQVCCVKWRWWVVQGDGGTLLEVVVVAGIVFTNMSRGRGLGPKTRNWVHSLVSGYVHANTAEMGCCMDTTTHRTVI